MTDEFRISGRWIRTATLVNEWYDDLGDPHRAIEKLRAASKRADLLSFIQRPPLAGPPLPFHSEPDHVAAIPVTTFENWFEKQVIKKVRKNVRRAQKYGVTVRQVKFDDELVRGILEIYREVPLRSGRPFKHYHDDFATCRKKHETFLDRSIFIAAFYDNRLIGFIKMVTAGTTARTMQNISLDEFRDYSPANALLAEAVKTCAERRLTHLVYGKLAYGNRGNAGLEEFKRANGFQRLDFPRYFMPLTGLGRLALSTGLHRDLAEKLPQPVVQFTRDLRTKYYLMKYHKAMARHEKTARREPSEPALA